MFIRTHILILAALVQALHSQYQEIKPNNSTELRLQVPFRDALSVKDFKVYELNLTAAETTSLLNKTIVFSLMPFSGSPSLSVNCDVRHKLAEFFEWQSNEDFHQEIVITASERLRMKCTGTRFYVGVATLHPTQFVLQALALNGQSIDLEFFLPASGDVFANEIVTYYLDVQQRESTLEMTAELESFTGQAQVYVRQCKTKLDTQCKMDNKDIIAIKESNFNEGRLHLASSGVGKHTLNFMHKPEECSKAGTDFFVCTYVIAVYGQPSAEKTKYRLLMKRNQTHTPLRETMQEYAYVADGQSRYFVFQVPNGSYYPIDKVKFQLTVTHGQVTMYVSRLAVYPSREHHEKSTQKGFVQFNEASEGALDTIYYVSVYGNQFSHFNLYAAIQRHGETAAKDLDFVLLSLGHPQTHTLQNITEDAFFKIKLHHNVSTPIHHRPNITILLRAVRGNFRMYVSNRIDKGAPNGVNCVWQSNGRHITIYNDDANYAKTLYVTVQSQDPQNYIYDYDPENNDMPEAQEVEDKTLKVFQIGYRSTGDIYLGVIGEQIIDVVEQYQPLYYKFLLQGYKDIQITKTIYSATNPTSLMVFISVNQTVQKPTSMSTTHWLINGTSITIPAREVIACEEYEEHKYAEAFGKDAQDALTKKRFDTHKPCYMYVAVYANAKSIFFSLNTHLDDTIIPLYEGLPQYFSFKDATAIKHFYFVPFYHSDIAITTHSPRLDLQIFVKVSKDNSLVNDYQPDGAWTYPTARSNDFASLENDGYSSNHIVVPLKALQANGCINRDKQLTCVVTVSVQINATDKMVSQSRLDHTFSISATQRTLQLQLSTPVVAYVSHLGYAYYSIVIPTNVTSILVSCTSLNDGDPDLFISKGHDERPTTDYFTWSSQSYKSDQVFIEGDDLAGEYIVAVYGAREAIYEIVYTAGQYSYFKVFVGQPVDVEMKAGQTYFFDLDYYAIDSLKVVVNRLAGHPTLAIKTYKQDSHLQNVLDHQFAKPTWSTTNALNKDVILINKNDTNFCSDCHYLIAIKSKSQDAHFTLEIYSQFHHMTLQSGKVTRDFLAKDDFTLFRYHTRQEFKIQLVVYSGKVSMFVKSAFNVTDAKDADQVGNYSTGLNEMVVKSDQPNRRRLLYVVLKTSHVIKVKALQDSNYTINILQDNQKVVLNWGRPFHSLLTPESHQIFTLHSTTKLPDKFITVALQYQKTWSEGRMEDFSAQVVVYHRELGLASDKNKEIHGLKSFTFKESQLYRIPDEEGIFDVYVNNSQTLSLEQGITLNYTIYANQEDLNILLPRVPIMNSVPVGQTDRYEIFIERPSRLFVEAFTCGGQILVQGSANLANVKRELYEVALQEAGSHIVGQIDVEVGTYYLGVKSLYRSSLDGSIPQTRYVIKVQQFPAGEIIPYDHFFQPDHGRFRYQVNGANFEIQMPSIQQIRKLETTGLQIAHIYYGVILAKDTHKSEDLMQCRFDRLIYEERAEVMEDNETHYHWSFRRVENNDTSATQTFSIPVVNLIDTQLHLLKGLAKVILVDKDGILEELTFPYEPVELYDIHQNQIAYERPPNKRNWLVLISLLIVAVVVLVGLAIFVTRYMKMKRRIAYEMQDVMKIAAPVNVEMNYQGFNEAK